MFDKVSTEQTIKVLEGFRVGVFFKNWHPWFFSVLVLKGMNTAKLHSAVQSCLWCNQNQNAIIMLINNYSKGVFLSVVKLKQWPSPLKGSDLDICLLFTDGHYEVLLNLTLFASPWHVKTLLTENNQICNKCGVNFALLMVDFLSWECKLAVFLRAFSGKLCIGYTNRIHIELLLAFKWCTSA